MMVVGVGRWPRAQAYWYDISYISLGIQNFDLSSFSTIQRQVQPQGMFASLADR